MPVELSGKHVVVMGLGRFGGGAGAAAFAAMRGARVTVSDRAHAEDLAKGLDQISGLVRTGQVELSLGGHDPKVLENADILIVNPAVPTPWNNPFIARARELCIRIETEIGLTVDGLSQNPKRCIAVSGSVGKSTTAAMIHHGLCALGVPAILGGNIGGTLLGREPGIAHTSVVVLELSSAMLYWLRETRPAWGPSAAVLTGFEPNHLDWHGCENHYRACKQWLLDSLKNTKYATAILGDTVSDWPIPDGVNHREPTVVEPEFMVLPGAHNRVNAGLAIAAIGSILDTDGQEIVEAVGGFAGLPHRLAHAGARRGIHCYNDSKSTTPGTTAAAVCALRERHDRVWLIAGGADKGIDLSGIAGLDIRGVLTIGATGPAIARSVRTNKSGKAEAIECGTLEAAVARAAERVHAGDALLLSPGCASWDQFENFEARGDAFIRLLNEHLGAPDEIA